MTDPHFVGRRAELHILSDALERLKPGSGCAIIQIAGPPGIGKSRLLGELVAAAWERGDLVLMGRGAEFEADLPFGMFNDAIDDWLRELSREGLLAVAHGEETELATVLPAFDDIACRRRPELAQERYLAYRAVRHLLAAVADDRPVVLVLDDVHWADPGSVELLSFLVAHPPSAPILLAVTFRPAQLPPRLAMALAASGPPGRRGADQAEPAQPGGRPAGWSGAGGRWRANTVLYELYGAIRTPGEWYALQGE